MRKIIVFIILLISVFGGYIYCKNAQEAQIGIRKTIEVGEDIDIVTATNAEIVKEENNDEKVSKKNSEEQVMIEQEKLAKQVTKIIESQKANNKAVTNVSESKKINTVAKENKNNQIKKTKSNETVVNTTQKQKENTTVKATEDNSKRSNKNAFSIEYWINYAISYGQRKGLVYDSTAKECWDKPIIAGAGITNLQKDIENRLNRYKNVEGFTDFYVWSEQRPDGKYNLYIGYA